MPDLAHILIAGSGPAGTATALGLKAMGFQVTVISSPRVFSACEGISDRVLQGLHNAGIRRALDTVAAPSQRRASWNGVSTSANTERLIRRDVFDEALLMDLRDAQIDIVHGRVKETQVDDGVIKLCGSTQTGKSFSLTASFFVDARGRNAPVGKGARVRGPETVSLLQEWRGKPTESGSAAVSFPDGWAWMAQFRDGRRYTQLTMAAETIPPRPQLADFFDSRLNSIAETKPFCENAEKTGDLNARGATAILTCDPVSDKIIRVGDAALAVDPLSGNGIFQALSTALIAPRIINTLLNRKDRAGMASAFYQERVSHAFMRFARMGRDFYRQENRWIEQPFWRERRDWPDQQAMHEPLSPQQITVARRPVVSGDFISEAEVVVTPDQPLGIWRMLGIELAPLVRQLQQRMSQAQPVRDQAELQDFVHQYLQRHEPDAGRQQLQALVAWINEQRLLG